MGLAGWLGTWGAATQELRLRDTLEARISLFISLPIQHTCSSFKTNHNEGNIELVISGYQVFRVRYPQDTGNTACLSPNCESLALVLLTWKCQLK